MFVGKHSQQTQIRGVMDLLDIADWLFARLNAAEHVLPKLFDVLRVWIVQARAFMNNGIVVVGWVKGPSFSPAHMEGTLGPIKIASHVFPFFSIISSESPMLPSRGEGFELVGGYLMIRGVGRLLFVVVDGLSRDLPATG